SCESMTTTSRQKATFTPFVTSFPVRSTSLMKKIVLTFGLISGAVAAVLMFSTMLFAARIGFDRGLIVGYTTIVVSLLLVPFGIRSYRENVGDGNITFG